MGAPFCRPICMKMTDEVEWWDEEAKKRGAAYVCSECGKEFDKNGKPLGETKTPIANSKDTLSKRRSGRTFRRHGPPYKEREEYHPDS